MLKEKVVYWAPYSTPDNQARVMSMDSSIKPLYNEMRKQRVKDDDSFFPYTSCPAFIDMYKNTYYANFLKDVEIFIDQNQMRSSSPGWFNVMNPSFQNRVTIELDMKWIFFSEEPLHIEALPPIFHKTDTSQHGMLVSGRFDIGSWFRPINLTYILWENQQYFSVKKFDPAIYFRFITEDKIKLKQFEVTKKITEIADACIGHPFDYKRWIPLQERYNVFKQNKLKDLLIKEIKSNIISDNL